MIKNLKFVSAGHFTSNGKWRHPSAIVSTWELIYMIEGEAHLYEGERRFDAASGDVFIFAPGIEHGGVEFSRGTASFFWVHVSADKEASLILSSFPKVMPSVKHTQIPILARQLLHRASHSVYSSEIRDLFATMLFAEYEVLAKETVTVGDALINKIREWVRINVEKPLLVCDIAREFGYNEDYIARIFKERVGMPLKAFINDMRMNALRNQLLSTDLPLKRIASDFGFADYKTFLKFFTYHEGITPTEFRESCYMTRKNNK